MVSDDEAVLVGKITAPHGIKGWVKVFSYTDPMAQILDYGHWTLQRGRQQREVEVLGGQPQGKGLIAHLKGIDDRNAAEGLRQFEIRISKSVLPALAGDEFYWYQLEGLVVRNLADERLGTVDHLFETGANDVLVVQADADSIDDSERLIPYVEDTVIREVRLGDGVIIVDWAADY